SVPGSQREINPRIRCQRTMMSICVWFNMCPMCRRPVTLGGGKSKVNTGRVSPGGGVGTEKSLSFTQYSAQRVSIAPGSYALGRSCAIRFTGKPTYGWNHVGTAALGCPAEQRSAILIKGEPLILQAVGKCGQTGESHWSINQLFSGVILRLDIARYG
ncbi:MAG: hypothetical protein JWQ49_64, partial [Edaphobacter sp.]|nr:hypothetical protein [Edaphobacter sp.]